MRIYIVECIKQNRKAFLFGGVLCILAILADPLYILLLNGADETSLLLIMLFLLCLILRLISVYRKNIFDEKVKNILSSFLRNKLTSLLMIRFQIDESNELLFNRYIPEISEYYVRFLNAMLAVLSFLLINITLYVEKKWMTLALICVGFIVLLFLAVYTKNFGEKYQNYYTSASESIDFQHNTLSNALIVQNEDAHEYIVGVFKKKMLEERSELELVLRQRLLPESLIEANFTTSNVFLPFLSLILIMLNLESPTALPVVILLSPHIAAMTNTLSTSIIEYREKKNVIGRFVEICSIHSQDENLTIKHSTTNETKNKDVQVHISGLIPHVNKKVDFTLSGNGLYNITGASGSGKTTLLRSLAKALESSLPNINGEKAVAYFDTQNFYLVDSTVGNIAIYLGTSEEKAVSLLERFCLEMSLDISIYLKTPGEYYHNLSDGQKKLLTIFIAYHSKASVLLLDEPTASLDPQTRLKVVSLICRLAKEKLVVFTSHDTELNNASEHTLCRL